MVGSQRSLSGTNIANFAEKQYRIITSIINSASYDSIIIYTVCSISEQETFGIIKKIFQSRQDIETVEIKPPTIIPFKNIIINRYGLLILPEKNKNDGFFIAILKKIK